MQEFFLDVLGEVCPTPLLKTQERASRLKPGDVLVVETDFSRTVRNIINWSGKHGFEYDIEEIENGIWQIKIRINQQSPGG